jgi:hypothetical protein
MTINVYNIDELKTKTFYDISYKDYVITVGYNIFDDKIIEDQLFAVIKKDDVNIYENIILNNEVGVVILNEYKIYFIYKYLEKEIWVFDYEDYNSLE